MSTMKVYSNRFDSKYREKILSKFSMNAQENLIETAFPIDEEIIDNKRFNKVISIDFFGISSSLFFDTSGSYNKVNQNTSIAFHNFLNNLEEINEKGIKVKIRLLFVYPYSNYAFNRIQAEAEKNRSSINERQFIRKFQLVRKVDQSMFFGSSYYKNQVHCLEIVQNFLKEGKLTVEGGPNTIRIRFTSIGTSLCMLRLNDEYFFDPYILSKKHKDEEKLLGGFPLININSKKNIEEFLSLEDHFRYIWTLDSTMYCEDATLFNPETNTGLEKFKTPKKIIFENKASRIQEMIIIKNEKPFTNQQINEWRFHLNQTLNLSTQNFIEIPERETIFISCSWDINSRGKNEPNNYAKKLKKWLNIDFNPKGEEKTLNIKLVEAKVGDSLKDTIYKTFRESSLALVIMKKDYIFNNQGYCKPNIYHELGYIIKQFEERPNRMAIMVEETTVMPSNAKDIVNLSFNENTFNRAYIDVLNWLKNSGAYLPKKMIQKAKQAHISRIL